MCCTRSFDTVRWLSVFGDSWGDILDTSELEEDGTMAVKKEPVAPAPVVSDKKKALETAMQQIEKMLS